MDEPKAIKCKLCKLRMVRQQEGKKEFEKQHCMTCYVFLQTLSKYEKALQDLSEVAQIHNRRVRIYLENRDAAVLLERAVFGKNQQYEDERR